MFCCVCQGVRPLNEGRSRQQRRCRSSAHLMYDREKQPVGPLNALLQRRQVFLLLLLLLLLPLLLQQPREGPRKRLCCSKGPRCRHRCCLHFTLGALRVLKVIKWFRRVGGPLGPPISVAV